MTIEELRKLLRTDIVTVNFTKKNGEIREMVCTTIPDYLPQPTSSTSSSVQSDEIVTVWDLEIGAWRSFRFDSLNSVDTDYFNYVV